MGVEDTKKAEGSFTPLIVVMIFSLIIAYYWDSFNFIKNNAHKILDPSLGTFLNWNTTIGMLVVVLLISVFITLIQKYTTDQKTLKEMKKEQKELSEEMKKYKEHPEKLMKLQKQQMEFIPKMLKLSMRSIIWTSIPLILLFRWFMDYFSTIPEFKFFGFLSWFWFYLLGSVIFGSFLRKWLDIA